MKHLILAAAALALAGCGANLDNIKTGLDATADSIDRVQATGVDFYDMSAEEREWYRTACSIGIAFAPLIEGTTGLDFGSVTASGCAAIQAFDDEPEDAELMDPEEWG